MHSEWMKVMLEEIARKREEAERGRDEEAKRAAERAAAASAGASKGSREANRKRR
jgi:hypothetical protein